MPIDYDQLQKFAGFDGHTERIPTVWHGIDFGLPSEVIGYATETGNKILHEITYGRAYEGYMDLLRNKATSFLQEPTTKKEPEI